MKNTVTAITIAIAALSITSVTYAGDPLINQVGSCPAGSTTGNGGSCTNQNQQLGDTTSSVTGDVQAPVTSAQQGVSSTSNASGNAINPNFNNKAQVTQNSTNATTGTIAGGNTNGTITGGNTSSTSQGNLTSADNRSSVGNTTTGPSTATTGPSTSAANSGPSTAIAGGGGGGSATNGVNTVNAAGGSANGGTANGGAGGSASGGAGGTGGTGGNSTSVATSGGNKLATSASLTGLDKSGNSTVDASNRSVTNNSYKATVWAPVIPGPAAAQLGIGNISVVQGPCGPNVRVNVTPVIGHRFGAWGGQQDVDQGQDETTAPAEKPFRQVGKYLMGERVIRYMAILGTSSAANFSIGGFTNNGGGAQGGAGGSGQMQQMVSRVAVEECVYAIEQEVPPTPVVVIAPPVVIAAAPAPAMCPSPVVTPQHRKARKHVTKKVCN